MWSGRKPSSRRGGGPSDRRTKISPGCHGVPIAGRRRRSRPIHPAFRQASTTRTPNTIMSGWGPTTPARRKLAFRTTPMKATIPVKAPRISAHPIEDLARDEQVAEERRIRNDEGVEQPLVPARDLRMDGRGLRGRAGGDRCQGAAGAAPRPGRVADVRQADIQPQAAEVDTNDEPQPRGSFRIPEEKQGPPRLAEVLRRAWTSSQIPPFNPPWWVLTVSVAEPGPDGGQAKRVRVPAGLRGVKSCRVGRGMSSRQREE